MKKICALLLSISLVALSFSGCGSSDSTAETTNENSAEASADASSEESTEASEGAASSIADAPSVVIADNSVEFAKNMKMGWNLGNTLDATGGSGLDSETSWGQPKTTQELIDYVKDAGFTSIRIPVSWSNHVDADNNIDEAWMKRVTEVVDYAYNDGLYIILNSHHDCERYYPTEEKYEAGIDYLTDIWTQICDNFKDYDERLVFESMNEPRLIGTNIEWWFADNDEKGIDSIKVIVKYNQAVVDTIRNGEGYNKTRYITVPSNAAAPQNAVNSAFTVPTDSANRMMVTVHAYTPYDFTMNDNGYSTWDSSKLYEFNFMDQLESKFIKNGVGVIIDEMGATNKDNIADRAVWSKDYTEKASSLGIPCFVWDNAGTKVGNENFGVINRYERSLYYPEYTEPMIASYNK